MYTQQNTQEKVDLPRYLPITISAECANCSATTRDAEKENYQTWNYEKTFCPECFARIHDLIRVDAVCMSLASIIGQRVTCVDEDKCEVSGILLLLKSDILCVTEWVNGEHYRFTFTVDMVADVKILSRKNYPYEHTIGFWNDSVHAHTETYTS